MKKRASLLLAGILALSLCACGSNANKPAETGTPETAAAETAAAEAPLQEGMPDSVRAGLTGSWSLDGPHTNEELKTHEDIYVLFGSGLRQTGAELILGEDGSFYCTVGAGFCLDGTFRPGNDNGRFVLHALGHDDLGQEASADFALLTEGDKVLGLTMEYDGETVYWIPAETSGELPEMKDPEAALIRDTVQTVRSCGFREKGELDKGSSVLSFRFKADTLQKKGDVYMVDVVLMREIQLPVEMSVGDECTLLVNELTGEQLTIRKVSDREYESVEDGYPYYVSDGDGELPVLYEGSADRVDCPFYEGRMEIRTDAEYGVPIMEEFRTITEEDLTEDDLWANGIWINDAGEITKLYFFGD